MGRICRLGLALALVATSIWACQKRKDPDVQRGAEISGVAAPRVTGPRLAERDLPTEPPFVGERGVDRDGHPTERPDKIKLFALLRFKRFAELERFMDFYQAAFERDYRYEYWPDDAVSAFYVADPSLEPIINEWVAKSPKSFAALVVRGNYRNKLGWYYRGDKYASDTSGGQFRSLQEYHDAARSDLLQAIKLRPRLVAAYKRLLQIAGTSSPPAEQRKLLDDALRICPLCYEIRAMMLINLTPRWGGSYQEMDALAAETKPLWKENPRLRMLTGYADWDRCDMAFSDKDFAAAKLACDAALATGDDPHFLVAKSRLVRDEKQYAAELDLVKRALRIAPHDREAIVESFTACTGIGDVAGAAEAILIARHLDPTDSWTAGRVQKQVERVRYAGDQLEREGKHSEAAKLFSLGVQLAPDDKDLMLRMAHSQAGVGDTPESMKQQLAAAPDDFQLRQRIDFGLAAKNRYQEVVVIWDEFIVAHANDPRPYIERGGAYWHLHNPTAALADMHKACELGSVKACDDVPKMKRAAGL